jgi:Fe-Mn family superoxide dismutase
MSYEAKNFESLLGIAGLSDQLINNHFALYQGYVANTNKLAEELEKYRQDGTTASPQYAELKRRFGWEFDGMRLHELYFGNLAKDPKKIDEGSALAEQIEKDFGTFSEWEKDFRATLAMRGIGWAILYYDWTAEKLVNVWINEHDAGHLAACCPILVIDAFEHAFMLDYGTKKAEYIDDIIKLINWAEIEKRFKVSNQ